MILKCFIHKIEHFIWNLLLLIKENLFLVILPVESQILYTDGIPVICQLHSCSIYDSLHFIWNNEFQILKIKTK